MKILSLVLGLMLVTPIQSRSQNGLKTETVSVFKNGLGFFVKSGNVPTPNGSFTIADPPDALFGTLWISASSNVEIFNSQAQSGRETDAGNIEQLLRANKGKSVTLSAYGTSQETAVIGDILDGLLELKIGTTTSFIKISQVTELKFTSTPSRKYLTKDFPRTMLLTFGNSAKNQDVSMFYMQNNIGWLPNYKIELKENGKANLILRANLINDAEDIVNTNLNFVVGVPNFKFSMLSSPLTSNDRLSEILQKLAYGSNTPRLNRGLSNIMTQSIINDRSYDEGPEPEPFKNVEGSTEEDLFFYTKKNVTLKKGDRASYPLLTGEVSFEHIYEVSLAQNSDRTQSYSSYSAPSDPETNKIWHSIKLYNGTKNPWTTGSAIIYKTTDGQLRPLNQDMLTYTPVNSSSVIRITVAPDIIVKDSEVEVSRKEKQKKSNYYYDLVTVEGTVELKNFKEKTVKIDLKRKVLGNMLSSDTDWTVIKSLDIYRAVNQTNSVNWVVSLKAKEAKTITYKYEVFIRQ